jgi:hypothetical protein
MMIKATILLFVGSVQCRKISDFSDSIDAKQDWIGTPKLL